mgnify:CR=1 FL=1
MARLESLDYLYPPSRDVAADAAYLTDVLGGRLAFAIEDGGTRVAMVELGAGQPAIVLNDHLGGERPILVYRTADLAATTRDLAVRGWSTEHTLEIPQGPVTTFRTPGGQRLAIYERSRPFVLDSFAGRRDF